MKCEHARERIYDSPKTSIPLRLHLLRCRACRAEAAQTRAVNAALASIPRFVPSPGLLTKVLAVPGKTVANTRKETGAVRRLIYAMAFLLLIGLAAAGVFTHSRPPDAKALLTRAAQAAETANSVHMIMRQTQMPWPESPLGMRMSPGYVELWVSARASAVTMVSPEGTVEMAMGASLDTGEEWTFLARMGDMQYVADLRPLGPRAAEIVSKDSRQRLAMYLGGQMSEQHLGLENMTRSVSTEARNGRKITLVTYTGTLRSQTKPVTQRIVFELDARSRRLLSIQKYAKLEGGAEELVGGTEKIEYDIPVPTSIRPQVGTVVPATARVEETATTLKLITSANGEDISTTEVPR